MKFNLGSFTLMRFATVILTMAVVSCAPKKDTKVSQPLTKDEKTLKAVSLFNSATEIIHALDRMDCLVGVDVTSKYPEQVNQLPKLGHYPNFNAEGIISLEPDVVLAREGEVKPELKSQLEQVGVEFVVFNQVFSEEGTTQLIRQVADVIHATGAERIIQEMKSQIDSLPELPQATRLLFIYARGASSLMVSGDNTQLSELFKIAGAQNAIAGFDKYKPLTPEALVEANPDAIVIFQSALAGLDNGETLWKIQGMENTTAGQNRALIVLDEMKASSFGPRLGQAAFELNQAVRQLNE